MSTDISRVATSRGRIARAVYADQVQPPTADEIAEARRHAEHVQAREEGLDHPAAGHEFDDHQLRDADTVPLRGRAHADD